MKRDQVNFEKDLSEVHDVYLEFTSFRLIMIPIGNIIDVGY